MIKVCVYVQNNVHWWSEGIDFCTYMAAFMLMTCSSIIIWNSVGDLVSSCVMQERGELLPPDDALDIARRVKETYCYTPSDIVKVLCCLEPMSWYYIFLSLYFPMIYTSTLFSGIFESWSFSTEVKYIKPILCNAEKSLLFCYMELVYMLHMFACVVVIATNTYLLDFTFCNTNSFIHIPFSLWIYLFTSMIGGWIV